jgi:hypothetical protein
MVGAARPGEGRFGRRYARGGQPVRVRLPCVRCGILPAWPAEAGAEVSEVRAGSEEMRRTIDDMIRRVLIVAERQ